MVVTSQIVFSTVFNAFGSGGQVISVVHRGTASDSLGGRTLFLSRFIIIFISLSFLIFLLILICWAKLFIPSSWLNCMNLFCRVTVCFLDLDALYVGELFLPSTLKDHLGDLFS